MLRIKHLLALAPVLLLLGCTDNPLEGKWKLKSGQDDFLCELSCKEVTYSTDEMICDGSVMNVSYDVRDQSVIIKQKDSELINQLMGDQEVKLIDKRTYSAGGGRCKWGKTI